MVLQQLHLDVLRSPFGLYNITKITSSGSSVGQIPINEVIYLLVFTPSSDVPVFPPIVYPLTFAFLPVPSLTTDLIMSLILLAFSSFIVSDFTTVSISVFSPVSESIISFTNLGFTNFPPFAILDTAVIS